MPSTTSALTDALAGEAEHVVSAMALALKVLAQLPSPQTSLCIAETAEVMKPYFVNLKSRWAEAFPLDVKQLQAIRDGLWRIPSASNDLARPCRRPSPTRSRRRRTPPGLEDVASRA